MRVEHETTLPIDPHIEIAPLAEGRSARALTAIAAEYAALACSFGLPMVLGTKATYRLHPDRLAAAGRRGDLIPLTRACVASSVAARSMFVDAQLYVAGCVGSRADGYAPAAEQTLSQDAALRYHLPQVEALAEAGVDLLWAATFATKSETVGVARAMAGTGLPYVLGPFVQPDGLLPDGTPLEHLIEVADATVERPPVHYAFSCAHPARAAAACRAIADRHGGDALGRVLGIWGNASPVDPVQLDGSATVQSDPPQDWADGMMELHHAFGIRVVGGCCGTDGRHLFSLASALSATAGPGQDGVARTPAQG